MSSTKRAAVMQLVQGAQAKALYGLVLNYKPLQALVDRLVEASTLTGEQVGQTLQAAGLTYFPDPFVDGFTWSQEGGLVYPGMPEQVYIALIYTKTNPFSLHQWQDDRSFDST